MYMFSMVQYTIIAIKLLSRLFSSIFSINRNFFITVPLLYSVQQCYFISTVFRRRVVIVGLSACSHLLPVSLC